MSGPNLLAGCVWRSPTEWPGRVQLLEVPDKQLTTVLQGHPGVYHHSQATKKQPHVGLYLPQNLVDYSLYPGRLDQYQLDPEPNAPSGRPLRMHQRRAVTFLRFVGGNREGAILAADMGAGKTGCALQSLYLDGLLEEPGIVCGPLASAAAWCGEGSDPTEHYGLDIFPLSGRKNPDISLLAEHKHFFIHYDILQPWVIPFTEINPRWVIFDESHYLMYQKAHRSEAAYNLSLWATIERRICLTGTPIPNRRLDLWHQLAVAQPRQWGGKRNWGERFCDGRRQAEADGGHWTYEGETNCIELRQRLCGTFLRYTRYDIADELPELSRRIEREEAPDEALTEYRRAASDVIRYLKDTGKLKVGKTKVQFGSQEVTVSAADNKPGAIHLRGLSVLIGLLSEYKAEWGANEAYRMLDYHDRIVVFTYRRASAKLIADRLKEKAEQLNGGPSFEVFGPIDGTIKQKDRQAAAKRFAKKPVAFYVATIGAAGISINELSVASGVLFVDLHWNPAVLTQAESRIHRDGSIHKKVESTFLVVKNTVDELFVEKLTEKAQAASGVSPDDEIGTHLVADLTATGSKDDPANLDEICAMLAQRKDLN